MIIASSQLYQTGPEIQRIAITIPSSLYFQSGVRDFTLEMVRNLTGLPDQWAFRFQTIVDELCNNAIEHGSHPGEEIALTFYTKPTQWLEVVVEDKGTGPKSLGSEELQKLILARKDLPDTEIHGLRGRGLARIVAKWTDELDFHDREGGGMLVRARKYMQQN